jgi:hypothetical protein
VIGACIVSIVIFVIGAILGAGASSSAVPLAGSTVTVTATATTTVKVKVTKKPKPAPTTTVTVRPKSRSAGGKETQSRPSNCTRGYSPCLAPASDYDCRGGSGNRPKHTGPVRVTGSDPYDLDRDGDGKACEWS